ncbi:MAG TPA: UbiA-like polyprenyltransferase [Gemmatimonadales bacterium]|jgi:4-hydroxybenzoate polyprenyltransferase|nr:UbiA-like polyprenyltransferase [Gemmatimonadales bacterium]
MTHDPRPATLDLRSAPAREGQTFHGESLFVRFVNFVKLPHTLFALPFAGLGVLAASQAGPLTWRTVALVVVAFSAARWVAMGFNRIADREIDARNPRTKGRELPRGALTLRQAWGSVVVAGALFVAAAWLLNPLCFALSPIALAWVMGYSFTKRFTSLAHLWLGLGMAIAPVGGYLAITGRWSEPWWLLVAVTVAVTTWGGGFDVFYALPDEGFDRDEGLRSLVVRLGQRRAILAAKLLHGLTIPALVVFGFGAGFGVWYYAGVLVAAAILAYEHQLVRPGDLSRLDAAFFTMNGVMSVTVFAFALLDRVVR